MKIFSPIFYLGLLFLLAGNYNTALAQEFDDNPFFDFNQKMKLAYQNALRMRIKDCKLALQLEKSNNPYNIMPYYVDDVADFMQVFANENHAEFLRMQKFRDIRLAKIRTGDKSSPYYLYCTAAIQLRWAWIHILFDEPVPALKAIKSAMPDIERNMKSYPDFAGSRKLLGIAQVMLELVEGKKSQNQALIGLAILRETIDYGKAYPKYEFNEETHFWYGLALLQLGVEEEKEWKPINESILNSSLSPAAAYIVANMHLALQNSTKALAILEKVPASDAFHPIHHLQYLRGLCLLYKFDAKADIYFKKFLTSYKGEHHHKAAIQKQAWSALVQQQPMQYPFRMQELLRRGNTVNPYDYYAEEEALRRTAPNLHILRTRLALLGGKYDIARAEIIKCNNLNDYDQAELIFLKARTEHKMKRYDNAIAEYDRLIGEQKHKTKYFYALAHLYSGIIWAERGNMTKARDSYNLCLKTNPDSFKKLIYLRANTQLAMTQNIADNVNTYKKGTTIGGTGKN
jgi:tetratricopeptide (TPR) repeat protein